MGQREEMRKNKEEKRKKDGRKREKIKRTKEKRGKKIGKKGEWLLIMKLFFFHFTQYKHIHTYHQDQEKQKV